MKPKYITLVIRQFIPGGTFIVWASCTGSSVIYNRTMTILEAGEIFKGLIESVREDNPADHFDFVVLEIDEVVLLLKKTIEEPQVNWIDFCSFYEGTRGVSISEVHASLRDIKRIDSGPQKCALFASLFADILGVSKAQQQVIAGAQKMSAAAGAFLGE